jgi:hypothetical protein
VTFATRMRQAIKKEGGKIMVLWDKYKDFPPEFLAKYQGYVLYDTFHHIKALLLYPLNCSCKGGCACNDLREKIVLALNVDLYFWMQENQETPNPCYAIRHLLKIPSDSFLSKHYAQSYPVWLIQAELQKKEADNHFKIVERLVWALLRLAQTYELSIARKPRASIKEAVELILGKTPLKTRAKALVKNEAYLCGEKAYSAHLNTYKSVCHFMAAYQLIKDKESRFSPTQPAQIQEFLRLSHWIREKLLSLETPNVKGKALFSKENILSLPPWVTSDDVNIPIHPFEDKL